MKVGWHSDNNMDGWMDGNLKVLERRKGGQERVDVVVVVMMMPTNYICF